MLIDVYKKISEMCNYALHLGLTEAGSNERGIVYSACALSLIIKWNWRHYKDANNRY